MLRYDWTSASDHGHSQPGQPAVFNKLLWGKGVENCSNIISNSSELTLSH